MSGTTVPPAQDRRRLQPLPLAVGTVAGFGLSSFGLALPWAAALLAVAAGLLATSRRPLLVQLALGLACGALAYIGLGLVRQLLDAPSADSGSS